MKRPKTIAAALVAAFLAFAPPGTLIAIAALILGLFGYCAGARDDAARRPQTEAPASSQTPPGTPRRP